MDQKGAFGALHRDFRLQVYHDELHLQVRTYGDVSYHAGSDLNQKDILATVILFGPYVLLRAPSRYRDDQCRQPLQRGVLGTFREGRLHVTTRRLPPKGSPEAQEPDPHYDGGGWCHLG